MWSVFPCVLLCAGWELQKDNYYEHDEHGKQFTVAREESSLAPGGVVYIAQRQSSLPIPSPSSQRRFIYFPQCNSHFDKKPAESKMGRGLDMKLRVFLDRGFTSLFRTHDRAVEGALKSLEPAWALFKYQLNVNMRVQIILPKQRGTMFEEWLYELHDTQPCAFINELFTSVRTVRTRWISRSTKERSREKWHLFTSTSGARTRFRCRPRVCEDPISGCAESGIGYTGISVTDHEAGGCKRHSCYGDAVSHELGRSFALSDMDYEDYAYGDDRIPYVHAARFCGIMWHNKQCPFNVASGLSLAAEKSVCKHVSWLRAGTGGISRRRCSRNADCVSHICVKQMCITRNEVDQCSSDADCAKEPSKHCYKGKCVACTSDLHCPRGKGCGASSQTCTGCAELRKDFSTFCHLYQNNTYCTDSQEYVHDRCRATCCLQNWCDGDEGCRENEICDKNKCITS